MLIGCASNNPNSDKGSYNHNSVSKAVHTGEIGDFKLTGPENGFITDTGLHLLGKRLITRIIIKLKSLAHYLLLMMMKMKSTLRKII